jgi:multidrug resistance protein, MATE family
MIISNLTVPLLGAVDTAVIGHMDQPYYLGAVAVGALVFNYLFWSFGFLRMGTTGLTAQAVGAGNGDEVRAVFGRAALLGLGLGGAAILLQVPIIEGALAMFNASVEVERYARVYFDIRIWSAPAVLVQYAILGWFVGVQNTRAVLILQVFTNGLNVVLDLWFVLGLGWGVAGVAVATVIAEISGVVLGVIIMLNVLPGTGGRWRPKLLWDTGRFRRLIAVNRDIFIRTLCLLSAFAWFTAKGAEMGDVVLAANAVLLMLQSFMAYGLDGFAHAAEALIGSAVGSRDRSTFRKAVRATTLWAVIVALGFTAFYLVFGTSLIALMTDIDAVRLAAEAFLPWMILSPLISVWGFQFDGIFIGATDTAPLRNSMVVALVIFILAVWLLVPVFGNHGLWLAFIAFMGLRGVFLGAFYPRLREKITLAKRELVD